MQRALNVARDMGNINTLLAIQEPPIKDKNVPGGKLHGTGITMARYLFPI